MSANSGGQGSGGYPAPFRRCTSQDIDDIKAQITAVAIDAWGGEEGWDTGERRGIEVGAEREDEREVGEGEELLSVYSAGPSKAES